MSNVKFSEIGHFVNALPPVADALAGTKYSDVISLKEHGQITFIVQKGVGTTGVSALTVQACDDTTPSNTSAITFHSRSVVSTDVPGDLTARTTAGYSTQAGSNHLEIITVTHDDMIADGNEYGYVRLKAVESADDPVLAGVLAVLTEPRSIQSVERTQIT